MDGGSGEVKICESLSVGIFLQDLYRSWALWLERRHPFSDINSYLAVICGKQSLGSLKRRATQQMCMVYQILSAESDFEAHSVLACRSGSRDGAFGPAGCTRD